MCVCVYLVTKLEDHFENPQGHLRAVACYTQSKGDSIKGGKSELRSSKARPQADSFLKTVADSVVRWRKKVSDSMPAPHDSPVVTDNRYLTVAMPTGPTGVGGT